MADGYGSPGAGHMRVRALFIADLHLGTRDCQAERLLDLLQSCDAELIYLVGDVVDGWRLKARWHWPRSHDDIVRCLLRKQQDGTRILYMPGNHDEFLRHSIGVRLGGIEVGQRGDPSRRRRTAAPGGAWRPVRPDAGADAAAGRARHLGLCGVRAGK